MRTNYIEILNNKVEIPIIQRDYAQGRTDNKTNKIRKDFLDVLFDFIKNKNGQDPDAEIELDFIYGFVDNGSDEQTAFIPIDGQQRLTMLWLLYWFISVKENIEEDEKYFLNNFMYETRHSTTEFCRQLLMFIPDFKNKTIKDEIINQAWYFETWDYDPSIQAMLVVLNDIEERYDTIENNTIWQLISDSECPFIFYKLDMNKVGLTDDLYIKMNSRGKALTEFEYFKAGFSQLLTESGQKERFEQSIDGEWMDAVWHIVFDSDLLKEDDDIALIVDNAFLNLFNFITSVISFKNASKKHNASQYRNTVDNSDLLIYIYADKESQNLLFDTLDAICTHLNNSSTFWNDNFYFSKEEYKQGKTRLFFPHNQVNLLARCLFHFHENKGFSYPEQLLLHACLTEFRAPKEQFKERIRTIRNLVVNSENELRDETLGNSFIETEEYIQNGRLAVFKNFKTAQIEEEKAKGNLITAASYNYDNLHKLEDSDILRGSISLLPLDSNFGKRALKFLEIFQENEVSSDFINRSNLLLCFGDYRQGNKKLKNMMTSTKSVIRSFFTTPGYSKEHFYSKTQKIVLSCLDYFVLNSDVSIFNKVEDTLILYKSEPKDWKYYFLKYKSFRENCTRGYYYWHDDNYCIWKMRAKQFNGKHWDPFLYEINKSLALENINLEDYGAKLIFTFNQKTIQILSVPNGFLFENGMGEEIDNSLIDYLKEKNIISHEGILMVQQNENGIDIEDRLEKLKFTIKSISKKYQQIIK